MLIESAWDVIGLGCGILFCIGAVLEIFEVWEE